MEKFIFKKRFGSYVLHTCHYEYNGDSHLPRTVYKVATAEEADEFLKMVAKLQTYERMWEHFNDYHSEYMV